jgi:hypothetical protein
LFGRKFPAFFAVGIQAAIAAEIAGKNANIGRFNMKIPVEVSNVTVLFFSYIISQGTQEWKRAFWKSNNPSSSVILSLL